MNSKCCFFLLGFILLFFYQGISKEKKKIQIKLIHADFIQKNERNAFFLIGRVHFQHNGYELFCDRAIYYKNSNLFSGYGNVQLKSDKNKIFSQEIEYHGNSNDLKVSGKVVFFQENIKLTANAINYNFRKKIFQAIKNVVLFFHELKLSTNILEYNLHLKKISYKKGGFVFYKDSALYSKEGNFFPVEKKAKLRLEVKLILSKKYIVYSNAMEYLFQKNKINFPSPTIIIERNNTDNFIYTKEGSFFFKEEIFLSKKYCSIHYNGKIVAGDYLFFDHKKKYGFIKNVFLEDTKKKSYVIGGNGYYDLVSGLISLKNHPVSIIKISADDSIFLYSDAIKIYFKNDYAYLIQVFSVKGLFMNENVQGKSDYLIYNKLNHSISFYGNPIFWINNQQFSGDFISIHLKRDFLLDYLKIFKNALYIKKTNSNEFNQIQGEIMIGFFHPKNILSKILIKGNVKSVIFPYFFHNNGNIKKIINKSSCGMIYMDLEEGKHIKKISCINNANSELLFLQNPSLNEPIFIPNFSWREKEKPKNEKDFIYKKMEKYRKESLLEKKEIKKIIKYN
ncbi:OstA-like protein [Blattabacterium cuenoti]|uniref:OstA-like protein n=1 Tax=Blattabacterium cuenoti TaxID=1653831 RepID=UPI00163D1501|nr:OstA-like protein [Blattabacterium cuenoti]